MTSAEAAFLEHVARVRDYLPHRLSEADTRANLIDPVLRILGYASFEDIRREVVVPATKEFLDYELRVDGKPQAIVEAKALHNQINDTHAAQCVQYATVLGVRWCLITNGMTWVVYNGHAPGPLVDKQVASVRLDGDSRAIAEAWTVLSLFSRDKLGRGIGLSRLLAERTIQDELSRPDSGAVAALRRAIKERFGEQVTGQFVVQALAGLSSRQAIPEVPQVSVTEPPNVSAQPAYTQPVIIRKPQAPEILRPSVSVGKKSLAALVEAGALPADGVLHIKLYGVTHIAQVRTGHLEIGGKLYASPSAAAVAIRGGGSLNGWVEWKYNGRSLKNLWDALAPPTQA